MLESGIKREEQFGQKEQHGRRLGTGKKHGECEELGEVKQNRTVLGRVCCSPWRCKGLDMTWQLNSNNSTKRDKRSKWGLTYKEACKPC